MSSSDEAPSVPKRRRFSTKTAIGGAKGEVGDLGDESSKGVSAPSTVKRRSCDICRRKKIRCDGSQMEDNRCSNCIAYSFDCTYLEAAKKRGPPKGYVESLENRLGKMMTLLHQLVPDADFTKELGTDQPLVEQPIALPSDSEDLATLTLAENLKRVSLDSEYRFFGKSSGAMLIQTALDIKKGYTHERDQRNSNWMPGFLPSKRPEYWDMPLWERLATNPPVPSSSLYSFPPPTLMKSLVALFFEHVNLLLPLLHRPTFEYAIEQGEHLKDEVFGANLLLVCAVGSRWSSDPAVLLPETELTSMGLSLTSPSDMSSEERERRHNIRQHSAGWIYFSQVQLVRKSLLQPPSLYDLQFYCLSVLFLHTTSAPQACWTMVGVGIRLAQDVGAHRKKVHAAPSPLKPGNASDSKAQATTQPMTVEDELWKRAWWVLVCLDRMISSAMGRPCAIQDEE